MSFNNREPVKYFSVYEYIDIETGEIVFKHKYEELYITKNTEKKTEYITHNNVNYGKTTITKFGERNRQTKLDF